MTRDSRFDRAALRRVEQGVQKARGRTIARLVAGHVERYGVEPPDSWLAETLGCSVAKVQKHRRLGR